MTNEFAKYLIEMAERMKDKPFQPCFFLLETGTLHVYWTDEPSYGEPVGDGRIVLFRSQETGAVIGCEVHGRFSIE